MKKYIVWIIPVLFLLTSCGITPWAWVEDALNNVYKSTTASVNSGIVSIPETKMLLLTQSGNTSEKFLPTKSLRIENYNVVLYSGTGKIDTLTTKGTAASLEDGSNNCEKNWGKPFVFYTVIKADGKYGLIEKADAMCGSDNFRSYYIYDFQKWETLISVEKQIEKYFWITDSQNQNYYNTSGLNLKSTSLNEVNNTLFISVPDRQPCIDGCLGYFYISDKLLQSRGIKRDWAMVYLPLQELLK